MPRKPVLELAPVLVFPPPSSLPRSRVGMKIDRLVLSHPSAAAVIEHLVDDFVTRGPRPRERGGKGAA